MSRFRVPAPDTAANAVDILIKTTGSKAVGSTPDEKLNAFVKEHGYADWMKGKTFATLKEKLVCVADITGNRMLIPGTIHDDEKEKEVWCKANNMPYITPPAPRPSIQTPPPAPVEEVHEEDNESHAF